VSVYNVRFFRYTPVRPKRVPFGVYSVGYLFFIFTLLFKGIIQRGKLVLKTVIYIPPLFVSSQTKRAYYMLKKRLQIVCEDTNEGLRFSKLRMPCHRTLYSSHLTLWTGTYYTNIQNFVSSQNTSPAHKFNTTYFTCSEKFMCGARVKSSSDYTDENNLHGYSVCTY